MNLFDAILVFLYHKSMVRCKLSEPTDKVSAPALGNIQFIEITPENLFQKSCPFWKSKRSVRLPYKQKTRKVRNKGRHP